MAEPTAHTEVPPKHTGFPPFETEHFPSQVVWLAFTFVLLYVLMSRLALPRVGGILAERGRVIGDDLAAADRLKGQSDAAHVAYEKSLADARARAQGLASATREQQAREAEALNKRLEAELHERLSKAEQSIAQTRNAAMGNVHGIAAEATAAIVERLIGTAPSPQDVAAALGNTGKA